MDYSTEVIKIQLPRSASITYISTATGEVGTLKLIENHLNLVRGRLYKLPVDTFESLDNYNLFKPVGKINEVLDIRNIENGFVFVLPIIHNVYLKDGMELGHFI